MHLVEATRKSEKIMKEKPQIPNETNFAVKNEFHKYRKSAHEWKGTHSF